MGNQTRFTALLLAMGASLCLWACSGEGGQNTGDAGDGGRGQIPTPDRIPPEGVGGFITFEHFRRPAGLTLAGNGIYTSNLKVPPGQLPEYVYYQDIPLDECIRPPSATAQPGLKDGGPTIELAGNGKRITLARQMLPGIVVYVGHGAPDLFSSQSEYTLSGGEAASAVAPFSSKVYSPGSLAVTSPDMSKVLPHDASQDMTVRWTSHPDGLPVIAELSRRVDGTVKKAWYCRFQDDGEATIPKVALGQMAGISDLFADVEVRLKIYKYRWTAVALPERKQAVSALVTLTTGYETTIDVPE